MDEQELIQAMSGSSVTESSVDPDDISKGETTPPNGPRSLLAFPAQSNFSGRKYPLQWVSRCQREGLNIPSHK